VSKECHTKHFHVGWEYLNILSFEVFEGTSRNILRWSFDELLINVNGVIWSRHPMDIRFVLIITDRPTSTDFSMFHFTHRMLHIIFSNVFLENISTKLSSFPALSRGSRADFAGYAPVSCWRVVI
jgi:hypothetical protein